MFDSEDRQATAQPQRVGASRTPALAVLLGALAILFTLVFVLPRLTPPPASEIGSPAAVAAPSALASPSAPAVHQSPSPSTEATAAPSATPAATPAPPVVVAVLGRWEFAPGELPNSSSTELQVQLFDLECNSGLTDPSQIQEPFIAYEETAVTIVFSILEVRHPDCSPGVGIPLTVELGEPLGERDLVDGGTGDLRFDGVGQFLVLAADPELARDHAAAMVPDACVTTISGTDVYPSYRRLNRMSLSLGALSGPLDRGRAFQGSWEEAARYFGAVQGYSDGTGFGYEAILAPANHFGIEGFSDDTLALVPLTPNYVDSGYEIWYPAFWFAGYEPATVYAPPPCE